MKKMRGAEILFGTGGPPESAAALTSMGGMEEVVKLGLDTMELEFVQGVRMGKDKAAEVGALAAELKLPLSVHAPYYVNLAAKEPQKIEDSIKRLLDSARIGNLCGADRVVFHAGFFMGRDRDVVYGMILENMRRVMAGLAAEGLGHVLMMPELTGKESQFGSPEELFRLCSDLDGVLPCMDFSHLYARTVGVCNGYDCFCEVFEKTVAALGERALNNVHVHLSGIEYTKKGERRHLNVLDCGIEYKEVIRALGAFGARARVVCESPDRGHDAGLFKKFWSEEAKATR